MLFDNSPQLYFTSVENTESLSQMDIITKAILTQNVSRMISCIFSCYYLYTYPCASCAVSNVFDH